MEETVIVTECCHTHFTIIHFVIHVTDGVQTGQETDNPEDRQE